jgi:uncharacterized protein
MAVPFLQGKTALVTGASSGLGAEFARQLAASGCSVILVARREERLRELQAEISARYAVTTECVAMDLAVADAPKRLYDQLQGSGRVIEVLINNAGFGIFGDFISVAWEQTRQMLDVNILALTHLTRLFAADMAARRSGWILLVASTGSFQPSPTYAAYSASKSYVLSLGEALHHELCATGVHCTTLCPGVTRTEFLDVAGQQTNLYHRLTMMDSPAVVRIGLRALRQNRSSIVSGRMNGFFAFIMRLLPRQLAAAAVDRMMH